MDYGLVFLTPQLYALDYFIKFYEDSKHWTKLLVCERVIIENAEGLIQAVK